MKTPIFIKIDGDIFNVSNIQALSYEDKKNELGNDRGVYMLHIYMKMILELFWNDNDNRF